MATLDFTDINDIYQFLTENPEAAKYKCVIIDSVTELQKYCMADIMDNVVALNPDRDPDQPLIGEWGKNANQMSKFMRAFRDLPIHVIMTDGPIEEEEQ